MRQCHCFEGALVDVDFDNFYSCLQEHWLSVLRYSSIITLKKLACAITHALHEQQKYRTVFASAREIDDVSTARKVLKNSSRV